MSSVAAPGSAPAAPAPDGFARAARQACDVLPRDADAGLVMAALGAGGLMTALYAGQPAGRLDPLPLRALLAAAAARFPQGTVLALCVQLATAVPLLAEEAHRSPVAAEVVREVLDGASALALAATDASAGSDLTALTTEVSLGDRLTLNGTKRWVTSAVTAGHALVLARHRPGRHFTSFSWVLVPLTAAGVTVRPADTDFFQGSGVGHLHFADVVLPRTHLVGRPGRGLASFSRHIAVERLASAAWAIELCRGVLADTERFLSGRTVEDSPLSRSPLVRHRLARCAVQLSALHALWTQSCHRVAGDHDSTAASVLKAMSAATVDLVLTECAQFRGADGFETGGIAHLRAESQIFGLGGGTTETVLGVVADRLPTVLAGVAP